MTLLLFVLLLLSFQLVWGREVISSKVIRVAGGSGTIRYFYDHDGCDSVVMIGVGTAMTVNDYDDVAESISKNSSIVTVIADHAPYWMIKTDAESYAKLANALVSQLQAIVPPCSNRSSPHVIVGGHSASGSAAFHGIPFMDFQPSGFVGLDPFSLSSTEGIGVASLSWGFTTTTCRVTIDQAALAAYTLSTGHRVLYRAQNLYKQLTHCSFTDQGCGFICPENKGSGIIHHGVGNSVKQFVSSVASGGAFDKDLFVAAIENQTDLLGGVVEVFVNEDMPSQTQECKGA